MSDGFKILQELAQSLASTNTALLVALTVPAFSDIWQSVSESLQRIRHELPHIHLELEPSYSTLSLSSHAAAAVTMLPRSSTDAVYMGFR